LFFNLPMPWRHIMVRCAKWPLEAPKVFYGPPLARAPRARYGPLVMDTDRPLVWTWNQEPFWNRVDGESKDVRPCSAWTLTNRPYEQRPTHGLDQV